MSDTLCHQVPAGPIFLGRRETEEEEEEVKFLPLHHPIFEDINSTNESWKKEDSRDRERERDGGEGRGGGREDPESAKE